MSRTLSRLKKKGSISLKTPQWKGALSLIEGEFPGFSRVLAGNLWFLLSYNGDMRDPLVFPQESQASMRVERAKRSYSTLEIPLQSVQGTRSSSRVKAGSSVFASSADMELRVPMEIQQGSQASSRVETCKSALLSSWKSSVRFPVG